MSPLKCIKCHQMMKVWFRCEWCGWKSGVPPMPRPPFSFQDAAIKGACALAGIVLLVVATIILLLLVPTGGYLSPGLDVIMALVFCVGLALVSVGFK